MPTPDAPTTFAEMLASVPEPAGATIEASPVDYELDGTPLRGYVAADTAAGGGRRPGVLVLHEWTGLGAYAEARSQMLARLGYVAFAADVFGRDVRPDDAHAPEVAGEYYANVPLWRARVSAGLEQLRAHPNVDPDRLAVVGYCFGGRGALELAQVEPRLAAAVAFHPTLAPLPDAGRVQAKLLVLGGDADPMIADDAIVAFKESLRGTGVDWQLVTYSGAMHAFSVIGVDAPDHGMQYQAAADRRSWTAMRDFFAEVLA
jgi:dienelactone hydrolase